MADFCISPKHKRSDFPRVLTLDDKIEVFEDRTLGWQLDIAERVANGVKADDGTTKCKPTKHSGFAVLHILFSYFEMIGTLETGYTGEGRSKEYFKEGFCSVFPAAT